MALLLITSHDLEAEAPESYIQEGQVPLHFPEWGPCGAQGQSIVNAQQYKLVVLFVKNNHSTYYL